MAKLQQVTVLGTGVLGAQIVFQCAYHGKQVVAYDVDEAALNKARAAMKRLSKTYLDEVPLASEASVDAALGRIDYRDDLAQAVAEADLVIEAVPEQLAIKQQVYRQLAAVAPEHTIFATNSSTLLPSSFAADTGRPRQFLALHFANHIWRLNTAEVMGTKDTDAQVYQAVVDFAQEIGMVPIQLHKEQPGYVLNSLLVPLLNAGAELLLREVASVEDIDKTWRIGTGSPLGPFQIYDIVGLNTAYHIAQANPKTQAWADYLKTHYIDQGRMGVASGAGFYDYKKP